MNDTLSICIPTYNRKTLLLECLDRFVAQVARHNIPICVSDNASEDGTIAMLTEYRSSRYPHLFFRSNATNLGIDRNMDEVVRMAGTKFCWLFGDDDVVREGAVDAVLAKLSEGVRLIVINASVRTPDLAEEIDDRRMKVCMDRTYEPDERNQFLKDTAQHTTYLGSLVVDRERWLAMGRVPYANDFLHVAIAFGYAANCRSAVIAEPYIQCRLTQASWSHRKFEVLMINWPQAVWGLGPEYTEEAKAAVTPRNRLASVRHLLAARAMGLYDRETYRDVTRDRLPSGFARMVAVLVACLPAAMCRAVFSGYLHLTRVPGYRLFLYDMRMRPRKGSRQ